MVSSGANDNRLVLGQRKVNEKSNEITAISELVSRLDIMGCVVTVDTLNTQTHLADVIVEAGADYIFAVKGNQGTVYEDLHLLFEGFEQTNREIKGLFMKICTCYLRVLSRRIMRGDL